MTDVYDERAAEAEDARPGAREAGALIARTVGIRGICDPASISNVIESELQRFEQDRGASIIQSPWRGPELFTEMTMDELLEATDVEPPVGVDPWIFDAARAATIRLSGSYSTSIGKRLDDFLAWAPVIIAQRVAGIQEPPPAMDAYAAEVTEALGEIQAHRRTLGMSPLDIRGAGWSNLDVLDEAKRIRRLPNPLEDLKHRLL